MKTTKLARAQLYAKFTLFALASLLQCVGADATAQTTTTFEEQSKLIRAPHAVASIGADLFGDRVNLSNGTLQFVQTDVSLPGNNALAVSIGRRFVTGSAVINNRAFGLWNIDIPHLHGVFSKKDGWSGQGSVAARCTDFGMPRSVAGTNNLSAWDANEFWQGSFLYTPQDGDQQMLHRAADFTKAPGSVASYPIVTTNFWSISCLPSLANPAANGFTGEGFVAVAPDGTSYRFDWMATYQVSALQKAYDSASLAMSTGEEAMTAGTLPGSTTPTPTIAQQASLIRDEVWIMPTLVTDRFGNWVRYTYDSANPKNLTRVESSDGRVLTLTYVSSGPSNRVNTVSDGSRTWTYQYDALGLVGVVLPDASAWQFGSTTDINRSVSYSSVTCDDANLIDTSPYLWTMTHPSGAIGEFTVRGTVHGRSDVPRACQGYMGTQGVPSIPRYYYTKALTTKTIRGPGIGSLTWNYDYGPVNASWAPCDACIHSKTVSVTDPGQHTTRYTFGIRYNVSDGRLEEVNQDNLRITSTYYRPFGAGPYPDQVGYDDSITSAGDGGIHLRLAPVSRKTITQQGTTFNWEATQFDSFARPTQVNRYSSLNSGRIEQTSYEDNLAKWILGQVKQVTELNTGKVMQLNTFDPTVSTVLSVTRFGKLQQKFTYYADGTLKTAADEKNPATTFSNYMRGIAQRIDYPDGTFEKAVVNNLGKVTSLTNEAGTTTTLGYDGMGRLASITHPQETGLTYNTTSVILGQINAQEFDLAPGHWRQIVVSGTAAEVNYYDALLRPIYTEHWDDADRPGTMRRVKHQYDFAGRTTYESYPKDDWGDVSSEGAYFQYDALGRPTANTRTSELGNLYENYTYHDGFVKRFVDAKGNGISYWHQAFDEPTDNAITGMSISEGVSVIIGRDVFGKPTSIARGGNGVSATRTYVYDGYERLCKTIEPETGATIQNYDAANNVLWRANGLGLTATNACNTADVPASKQIGYTYDARNRLRNTTYGDGSPAIYRTYTADGLPDTVQSDGTLWTYGYNNRRLPISETLSYGGVNYRIGRSYDTNGSLSQLTYPDNSSIAYNPNALGEARQAGGYATGVTYHPSGAIRQFSYGNGILHTLTQNARGLPQVSQDGYVLNDRYSYDQVANVIGIADQAEGVTSRSMEYDTLNRLKRVSAPALWGDAWYNYDTLDNITSSQVTGGAKARTLTHNIDYATNRLSSLSGSYGIGYQYDSQGNIVQRGGQGYGFDIGNRMRSAPGVTTHAYDGLGRRTSVVGTDGVNHIYVYGQEGRLLYETRTGQALSAGTKYVYLNRHVVAEVSGSGVVYDHTDGLGSPVAKTNANAGLISRTRYEPYGATAAGTEPTIGFTGHLNAANLGLVDMQQRFYDPVAGRFLSIDPVVADANSGGSFNRYAYANNQPYKYIDSDGREPTQVFLVYTPLAGGSTNLGYHMFVKVVGDDRAPFYTRAGPSSSPDSTPGGRLSSDAAGSADRTKQAGYGNLKAAVGDEARRADAGDQKFQQHVGDVNMTVAQAANILTNFSNAVNSSSIPYIPTSQNSNAYATQAVTTLGLPRPTPAVTAVGSQTQLPVKKEADKADIK